MEKERLKNTEIARIVILVALGAAAGTVNGLFGTGGGTLMVLLLPRVCKELEGGRLFANVCAAILPISVVSAFTYSRFSPPDVTAIWVAVSAVAGGAIGAVLLGRIKPRALKLIFSAVMAVSGVVMLVVR